MKKVEDMTEQEKRTEIAYLKQSLENLQGRIPDKQFYEEKERRNKRIKELGGNGI
jgi:hypothetical protein